MPYRIEYSAEARADLKTLDRLDQAALEDAIPHYLGDQPDQRSRRRKRMEPNPVGAPWALRLDDLRVYYDIETAARVLRVGQKRRNRVFLRGVETDLREVDE